MSREEIIAQYNIIPNNSKIYYNGSVWHSNSSGKFTIIAKTDRHNKKGSFLYCLCEFDDGAIVEADFTNIKNGNVRSPNTPNVCGVGYMGQGKWNAKINGVTTKEYSTWLHMMSRCYSQSAHIDNPTYKDVIVCERWHCFQNFCDDIQKLTGYKDWKDNPGYELDKDIICESKNIQPKMYSADTCMFVKKCINLSESTSRNNKLRSKRIFNMDMNNLFVTATRCKFRFPFKGQISVEDLWDLSVKNLDTIFKALNAEAKQAKEESLLATKSAAEAELEAKIEIIKYIVAVKQEEAEQKATAAANKEQQRRIDEIIAAKQDQELQNMSIEDLIAMRNNLG